MSLSNLNREKAPEKKSLTTTVTISKVIKTQVAPSSPTRSEESIDGSKKDIPFIDDSKSSLNGDGLPAELSSPKYVPGSFSQKQLLKNSPSSLTSSFDKSIMQISDWLNLIAEITKKPVTLGDTNEILNSIEKQKVKDLLKVFPFFINGDLLRPIRNFHYFLNFLFFRL
jgi:hypothetical protein